MYTTIRPKGSPMIYFLICTRLFDQIIGSSFIYYFFSARPFNQKLVSSLILFFYLYLNTRPKLGFTLILKFIISLVKLIFCLQYCLYISFATIIPLYFVYYIHRSVALIFCTLYPWLYKVLAAIRFLEEEIFRVFLVFLLFFSILTLITFTN